MPINDADRDFLSQAWRYVEMSTPAVKVAHPGAREADRNSPFVNAAGATAVLTAIHSLLSGDPKFIIVELGGIVSVSFAGKPPVATLFNDRWGLGAGRNMRVVRVDHDWSKQRTSLYLWG